MLVDGMLFVERQRIAELAATARLPAVYGFRDHVDAGGLVSYGVNLSENFRRAATYVDKIIKGAKPGDLPVEFPTKLEMVINLKTAKALGLTVPPRAPRTRRRGDRIEGPTSEFGTKRTCRGRTDDVAVEGRTDMPFKQGHLSDYRDVVETLKGWCREGAALVLREQPVQPGFGLGDGAAGLLALVAFPEPQAELFGGIAFQR